MNEVEYLQQKIKKSLKEIRWTQRKFAEELYNYNYIDENEINKETEKIKKHLQRKTTNIEILKNYLLFLSKEEEIYETYLFDDEFDLDFNKRLKEISQNMYEKIAEKNVI